MGGLAGSLVPAQGDANDFAATKILKGGGTDADFTAAIAAMPNGGVIYFEGTYTFGATVALPTGQSIKIIGGGKGVSTIDLSTYDGGAFGISTLGSGIFRTFEDFHVKGTNLSSQYILDYGGNLNGAGAKLSGVTAENIESPLYENSQGGLGDVSFHNCEISGNGDIGKRGGYINLYNTKIECWGITPLGVGTGVRLRAYNSTIYMDTTDFDAIGVLEAYNSYIVGDIILRSDYNKIVGCLFEAANDRPLDLISGSDHNQIVGNVFDYATAEDIRLASNSNLVQGNKRLDGTKIRVAETGAANSNIYDNVDLANSTITGLSSSVRDMAATITVKGGGNQNNIQKAINALGTTGGVIYLEGTYNLTASITIQATAGPIKIIGGPTAKIALGSTNDEIFYILESGGMIDELALEDVELTADGSGAAQYAFNYIADGTRSVTTLRLTRVVATGFRDIIYGGGQLAPTIYLTDCDLTPANNVASHHANFPSWNMVLYATRTWFRTNVNGGGFVNSSEFTCHFIGCPMVEVYQAPVSPNFSSVFMGSNFGAEVGYYPVDIGDQGGISVVGCTFGGAGLRTAGNEGSFIGNFGNLLETTGADTNVFDGNVGGTVTTLGDNFSKVNGAYRATSDPGTGDDVDDGVKIGDHWINTSTDKEFVCLDNTATAAVWTETTAGGGTELDRLFCHTLTPSGLTGSVNNYDPGNCLVARITANGNYNITGLAPTGGNETGTYGRRITLHNYGSLYNIYLMHEDVGSSGANQFSFSDDNDRRLEAGDSIDLQYDITLNKWTEVIPHKTYQTTLRTWAAWLQPAQITTNVNNWNPGDGIFYRIYSSAQYNITGIQLDGGNSTSNARGREIVLYNYGNYPIIIKHQDTGSSTNNRIICPLDTDYRLAQGALVRLVYDNTSTVRWRVLDRPANNFEATTDPTTGDDENDGFAQGSLWLNTSTSKLYVCISSAVGSANWQELTTFRYWTKQTSPAQITGNQNNYNPGDGSVFRISSDAARDITGLAPDGGNSQNSRGRKIILMNIGAFAITLKHQNAGSTDVNRIYGPGAADITIAADYNSVELVYDLTLERWTKVS